MKRIVAVVVVISMILGFSAVAETGYPPYDFLAQKGYQLQRIDNSPGWKTCNLMGGEGWWGITFSDQKDSWMLMALPMFNPTFKLDEFEGLFVEMVEKFDWDVSFYWPGYELGEKMVASYNIVKDIDKTEDNYTDKHQYAIALRKHFDLPMEEEIEQTVGSVENSRRNPAVVGQHVKIDASRRGLDYTMSIVVDEFFRGEEYVNLTDGKAKTASEGYEYVAVKVTVTFESINSIQSDIIGTDDPEIMVDSVFSFASYSAKGSKYDNVHYSISGKKDLTYVYEGASTTGYFQFEIAKDDTAPMLVYEPERNQRVFISLT